jgi:hypothetical protein
MFGVELSPIHIHERQTIEEFGHALVLTLVASTTAVYAGSCTEIDRIELFISAQLGTVLAEVQRLIGP